jgi:hypothetical protein
VLKQAEIHGHLGRRLGDAAQRVEDDAVALPRVGSSSATSIEPSRVAMAPSARIFQPAKS